MPKDVPFDETIEAIQNSNGSIPDNTVLGDLVLPIIITSAVIILGLIIEIIIQIRYRQKQKVSKKI